ncbi:hypothetical protein ACWEFD_03430 [Streptomyces ardesiacus]|uniref:hypothetical protein n=1 Tax=unclassified Streptomyces TaxID=2593676 RepID=UPI003B64214A
MDDGEPVAVGDAAAHSGRQVGAEIVPDQHDRAAELLVGGLDQVALVLPGEALAPVGPDVREQANRLAEQSMQEWDRVSQDAAPGG